MLEHLQTLERETELCDTGAVSFHADQVHLETADGSVCCIYSSRLDDAADDRHAFLRLLQVDLVRV